MSSASTVRGSLCLFPCHSIKTSSSSAAAAATTTCDGVKDKETPLALCVCVCVCVWCVMCVWEKRNTCKVLVGKPEGKKPLLRQIYMEG